MRRILTSPVFALGLLLVSAGFVSASNLPACPPSGIRHNCFGEIISQSGKYVGEWRNDDWNGQGSHIFTLNGASGDFSGEFINGEFQNGYGRETTSSGFTYIGEYKKGLYHGKGKIIRNNELSYEGHFESGFEHGYGIYFFPKDQDIDWGNNPIPIKYEGFFDNGKFHGKGILTYEDETFNEGVWKDGYFQYAKKLAPSSLTSKTPAEDNQIISASSGSGFAVSSDGYVITNHHVIDGCEKVMVLTNDKKIPVTVVTYDPQNDLALLKGDFRPLTVFPLSSNRPELLQDVYVAGFPFGGKFSTSVKVTKGIISSLTGLGNNFSNIQIDAALQIGNSGGPIVDNFGNVVGVAVSKLDAKYMFEEFGVIPENTNFGIKANVVRSILDSNNVDIAEANKSSLNKTKLGEMISDGTYYIDCLMTLEQIKKIKTKKVLFKELE